MSIRKYTNPRDLDLSHGLQQLLRNNGMQAHITIAPNGELQMTVLGHDSPAITYKLSQDQAEKLMTWGDSQGHANKVAYKTFNDIVKNDFHLPDNYVTARNAGGSVMMGQHGYYIQNGEYGFRSARPTPFYRPFTRHGFGWGGDFIGWRPRPSFGGPGFIGYHGRRIGDRYYSQDRLFVAERPDGRRKPGELRSGGYGYYYKGGQRENSAELQKPALEIKLQPLKAAERPPQGQALVLKDEIASNYYFSKDKFQEVLKSHGIIIDEQKGELTVQSSKTRVDIKYTGEETKKDIAVILAEKLPSGKKGDKGVSYEKRLEVLNNIIAGDFSGKVTMDMLNSKEIIDIDLKPEVKAVEEAAFIKRDEEIARQEQRAQERKQRDDAIAAERSRIMGESDRIARDIHAINGREIHEIMGNKGFFTAMEHGRQLVVGEIRVDETSSNNFTMSAVINGVMVEHSIDKKQYDQFLQLDDKHRLKLFDKVFSEVEIKSDHGGRDMAASPVIAVTDNGKTEYISREQADIDHATSKSVDGSILEQMNHTKGFYREINHGREVNVGNIYVEKVQNIPILAIDDPAFIKDSTDEVKRIVDNHIAEFKEQRPTVPDVRVEEERKRVEPLATQLTWYGEEGRFEPPVKGMTPEDINAYADRVATAKVMSDNGYLSLDDAISTLGPEVNDYYKKEYDKAYNEAKRNAEDYQVAGNETKYRMTAIIDGVPVVHEISQRDYDKFLAVDDRQRLNMFAKIFNEVDIKTRPEYRVNVGAAIAAALVAGVEVVADVAMMPGQVLSGRNPVRAAEDIARHAVEAHMVAQQNFNTHLSESDDNGIDDVYHTGRGV